MTTGKSYLSGDLGQDLGGRIHCSAWPMTENLTDHTPSSHSHIATGLAAPSSFGCSAIPLRGLEPGMLDDVNSDVDDYAVHCLSFASLESLFDAVIATAEMRAGEAVVREVLTALAGAHDRLSAAELAGPIDEHAISVAHVLSILANHLHRDRYGYRLAPALRAAVERRYPLAGSRPRPGLAAMLRNENAAVEVPLSRRTWRQSA